MWDKTEANLGILKPNSVHKATFRFTGSSIELNKKPNGAYELYSSCECSSSAWDDVNKTLTITFKAKNIPNHLKAKGEYQAAPYVYFPCTINGTATTARLGILAVVRA